MPSPGPLRPKKRLGQNFMRSERDLDFLASSLSLQPSETVLEIGPGTGLLTRKLIARGCRVVAVEKDGELVDRLKKEFWQPNFELIHGDILRCNIPSMLNPPGPIKVVGNIPYNITTPILEWLIAQKASISQAVLTVQWEVARRLVAKPGNKDWGSLSVFLQLYTDVELLRKIDKSHFYPAPKVDSGIVRLRFLETPRYSLRSEAHFFSLVRKAFQKRRKTLLNALADKKEGPLSKTVLLEAFSKRGIEARRRPETLSLLEWAGLSDSLGSAVQK